MSQYARKDYLDEKSAELGRFLRDQIKAGIFNRNVYDAKSGDFIPAPTA